MLRTVGPEVKENRACVGGPREQALDASNMFTLAFTINMT